MLMKAYWSPTGWHQTPALPDEATFEKMKSAGIMFANDRLRSHDHWVARARAAAQRLTLSEVRDGFLASLTSRRLDLRSALSSYIIARSLPDHHYEVTAAQSRCLVCDAAAQSSADLNILNFERFKWGGVRKLDIGYIAFDLEQFERAPKLKPSEADQTLGREIFAFIQSCPPSTTPTQLAQALKMLPGNKDERISFIDTLGIVEILKAPEHPGFLTRFVPSGERNLPNRHYVEDGYPVCWWTAANGVSTMALLEVLALKS
ncbi:hypothetical protein FQP90_07350 [Paenarthrobacter nitroguajacolicus]|uniref:Uncharacterized protein n=1 Tax=Paenarthrobacter nitroguajacolicus TaxID=211146 RepID=A0A558H6W2_PAENT|nr:hypothetical protein [Paenarthrobacter nitroguajacolicus]TVU64859.1 hypothetical protein FQP90_07350 [Paenarthrobacter nitroguajacolicus]